MGLPVERSTMRWLNPFRTAVPFWGQTSQIPCSSSPKRDCGSKGVNGILAVLAADAHILPSANIPGAQFSVLTIIVFVHRNTLPWAMSTTSAARRAHSAHTAHTLQASRIINK